MINCPYCGKLTDPKLDGCPHCGGFLKKKLPVKPPVSRNSQSCPSCRTVVQQGDIICVVCGTNLLTGQKVADAPEPGSGSRGVPLAGILIGATITLAIVLGGIGVYMVNSDPVERARAMIDNFEYPEAQELLQDYVREDPDNEEAMFELAKLQWRTKAFGDAAISFQNVIDINPGNVDAGLFAVLALQLSGTSSSMSQEIAILERMAEYSFDNAEVLFMLAMAKGARGEGSDYEDQFAALEQVLLLSPQAQSVHLNLGIAQALMGNYRIAQSELKRVSAPEQQGNALAFLGYIAAAEQEPIRALNLFEESLNQEGLSIRWQAQTELAKLQIQAGRFHEAEVGLQEALRENPTNELGRYLLGIALHSMGRANEALNQFEDLSNREGPYRAVSSVQAASLRLLLGDTDSAERFMNIARRAKLESPAYYTVLGRVQLATNQPTFSMEAFDTAIRMNPAYAPAYLERGLLFIRQDRMQFGLRDLNNYIQLVGRDVRGTKVNEIRLLANQIQRTLEKEIS